MGQGEAAVAAAAVAAAPAASSEWVLVAMVVAK